MGQLVKSSNSMGYLYHSHRSHVKRPALRFPFEAGRGFPEVIDVLIAGGANPDRCQGHRNIWDHRWLGVWLYPPVI